MIPPNINREHVIEAAKWIDVHGVPDIRKPKKYVVDFNGKAYPPKYLLARANVFANGQELDHSEHTGGKETNTFLLGLGFRIVDKKLFSPKSGEDSTSNGAIQRNQPKDSQPRKYNGDRKRRRASGPPISRIIIDGSNLACYGMPYGSANVTQLSNSYDQLISDYGFEDVKIIIGSGLWRKVNKQDFESLTKRFESERAIRGHGILFQAPAKQNDDTFIIDYAINEDYLILSNDLYRDHLEERPEDSTEIQRRLVKYMVIDNGLRIVEFPDY